jgi:hypothetical protein
MPYQSFYVALVLALLTSSVTPVDAVLVNGTFNGTVTRIVANSSPQPSIHGVAQGAKVIGSFTYDSSAADNQWAPDLGSYSFSSPLQTFNWGVVLAPSSLLGSRRTVNGPSHLLDSSG